jgi:hypothetical protein
MNRIFFSQAVLDALIAEGRITLDGAVLTLLAPERSSFTLVPAFRITATADNGPDPHGLVGQIKYEKDLKAAGSEIYLDSVIFRETAYRADPGFVGEQQELLDRLSDTDLLARFLLESLL